MARIDAVTLDDLRELADELWAPERLSAAGIGPDEDAFRDAVEPRLPERAEVAARRDPRRRRRRRGAHGAGGVRRGRGRRGPRADRARRSGARTSRRPTCSATPTCSSTSRGPTPALDNARAALGGRRARRHRHHRASTSRRCARPPRARSANVVRGAELRDRRGADDALRRRGVAAHGSAPRSSSTTTRPSSTRRRAPPRARPS